MKVSRDVHLQSLPINFGMSLPSDVKETLKEFQTKKLETADQFEPSPLEQELLSIQAATQPERTPTFSIEALFNQLFRKSNTPLVRDLLVEKLMQPEKNEAKIQHAQKVLNQLRQYLIDNPAKKKLLDDDFVLDLMDIAFKENVPSSIIKSYTSGVFPDSAMEAMYLQDLLKKTNAHQILFDQLTQLKTSNQLDSELVGELHQRLAELETSRGAGVMWADGMILEEYRKRKITPSDEVLTLLLERTNRFENLTNRYAEPAFDEAAETAFLQVALENTKSVNFILDVLLLEAVKSKDENTEVYLSAVEALHKYVNLIEPSDSGNERWPWDKAIQVLTLLDKAELLIEDEMILKPLLNVAQLSEERQQSLIDAFGRSRKKQARLSEVYEFIKQEELEAEKHAASEAEKTEKQALIDQKTLNRFKRFVRERVFHPTKWFKG